MSDDDTNREQGVDFTGIDSVLEEISNPITTGELIDEYGERTIERTNAGPITISELFEPLAEDTFESPEEIRQSILSLMPEESLAVRTTLTVAVPNLKILMRLNESRRTNRCSLSARL